MPPKPTKSKVQPPTHPTTVNTRSRTKEAASQHVSEGQDALTNGNESDDLEGMDAVGLKQKLLAECALWGTCKPKSAVDMADSLDDGHEDKTTNQPTTVDMNAYDTADNAIDNAHMDIDEDEDAGWYMGKDFDASNSDNADAEPAVNEEDDEEDNEEDNEEDDEDNEIQSSRVQVLRKSKSRADARCAEVPTWDRTPRKPHHPKNSLSIKYTKASRQHCDSVVGNDAVFHATHTCQHNKGWHESAHYTTIRSSIQKVVGDTLFKNAFPSLDDSYKPFHKVLRATALQLKYSHLAHRFTKNPDFSKQSAHLIAQRLADIHGKLKNMANDKIPAIYGLKKLDYDQKSTGEIDGGKPFQHPAIISLLIGKNELEIPAAMLTLIATMVYACLRDWKSGELNSRSDFSVDFLTDVYRDHIEFLGNILDGSKAKYHCMMHNLYIISATHSKGSLPASNNAIGLLNFDEMEDPTWGASTIDAPNLNLHCNICKALAHPAGLCHIPKLLGITTNPSDEDNTDNNAPQLGVMAQAIAEEHNAPSRYFNSPSTSCLPPPLGFGRGLT
ncbi:hypothetical protein BDQ17DRAFT_1426593 [Cyathus striatus]|nr:hypothetical protein BDQ17DRAFT_1426593 [Cyathus striatus]